MNIICYSLTSFFSILLIWAAGNISAIPFLHHKIPSQIKIFIKLALGYLSVTLAYSLYHTKGYSVFFGIMLLYLMAIWLNIKKATIRFQLPQKKEIKYLSAAIGIIPIFLAIQLYRNDYINTEIIYTSYQDHGIYITVSEYLKITGIEVSSPWYQLFDISSDKTAKIYHYLDFWFSSFMLDVSSQTPSETFNYISAAVLSVIIVFGNISIFFTLNNKTRWYHVICIATLSTAFTMVVEGFDWSYHFDNIGLKYPRIAPFPILLTLGIIALKWKLKFLDSLAFGSLILSDAIYMPSVFLTMFVVYSYYLLKKREKELLIKLSFMFFSVLFVLIFYTFFGSFVNSSTSLVQTTYSEYLFLIIKNITALHVKHLIFFLPIYIFLIFYSIFHKLQKTDKAFYSFLFILLFSSSIVTSLMCNNPEGIQFAKNVHPTVSSLMLIGGIAILTRKTELAKNRTRIKNLLLIVFSLQLVYGTYSTLELIQRRDMGVEKQFLSKVAGSLKNTNKIGVCISNIKTITTYTLDPRICQYCDFLKLAGKGFWANQINIPLSYDEIRFKERTKAVEISPFYRFVKELEIQGSFTNINNAQIDFINKYDVDFVVVEKGAEATPEILNCTDYSIMDDFSKTKILFLKRPCSCQL
jgi:hypothetical protein